MNGWLFWIGVLVALVVAAALVEVYLKRNRTRNLADMRPDPDKISKVGGIERYGLDPLALAQAEQRRLDDEGWNSTPSKHATTGPDMGEEDKQDERR